uniref:Uncharacterized protein n=1 Tax=Globodera rostochiensis TaxID=31243 RepID=A0A914HVU8_GLORO
MQKKTRIGYRANDQITLTPINSIRTDGRQEHQQVHHQIIQMVVKNISSEFQSSKTLTLAARGSNRSQPNDSNSFLTLLAILHIGLLPSSDAIQCYSGNQFSIIECPSLYCIKQTLGLDTVRYCDGTGVSSICSTYRIIDTCQSVPTLGYVCCCSDQLCNSTQKHCHANNNSNDLNGSTAHFC